MRKFFLVFCFLLLVSAAATALAKPFIHYQSNFMFEVPEGWEVTTYEDDKGQILYVTNTKNDRIAIIPSASGLPNQESLSNWPDETIDKLLKDRVNTLKKKKELKILSTKAMSNPYNTAILTILEHDDQKVLTAFTVMNGIKYDITFFEEINDHGKLETITPAFLTLVKSIRPIPTSIKPPNNPDPAKISTTLPLPDFIGIPYASSAKQIHATMNKRDALTAIKNTTYLSRFAGSLALIKFTYNKEQKFWHGSIIIPYNNSHAALAAVEKLYHNFYAQYGEVSYHKNDPHQEVLYYWPFTSKNTKQPNAITLSFQPNDQIETMLALMPDNNAPPYYILTRSILTSPFLLMIQYSFHDLNTK